MIRKATFIVILLSLLPGCALFSPWVRVTDANERINLWGYSIMPPKGENWYCVKGNDEIVFKKNTQSPTHSAFAKAGSLLLKNEGNPEEILPEAYKQLRSYDFNPDRFKDVKSITKMVRIHGAACLAYSYNSKDLGASNIGKNDYLLLVSDGILCMHPNNTRILIDVCISERKSKDDAGSIDRATRDLFLNGFSITR